MKTLAIIVFLAAFFAGGKTFNTPSESILYSFRSGADGINPYSPLIADGSGALYGTTIGGGAISGGQGIIFKLIPAGTTYREKILFRFHGPDGASPQGGLLADSSGALYGTTQYGGRFNDGTVFKLTPGPNGYTQTVLYSFGDYPDGRWPLSALIMDSAGSLYGTTELGGNLGVGSVFKLTPHGSAYSESVLYSFQDSDGDYPFASLIADSAGALYGTTYEGGAFHDGTVFKVVPRKNGLASERVLWSFQGGIDGVGPVASLIADASGALYGTTKGGGLGGHGCAFKLTPNGRSYSESLLYSFRGGSDGAFPSGSLSADKAGALYGTTAAGGNADLGTVFKLTPRMNSYSETILHRFTGGADGSNPFAAVNIDKSGVLFGTSNGDNPGNDGSAFKLTPKGAGYHESILHTFHWQADGANSVAALVGDPAAAMYGTTSGGGSFGQGTVFKLIRDAEGYRERVVYRFTGSPDGSAPFDSLTVEASGALYGTTFAGGSSNTGSVFKLTPNGDGYRESVLYSFHGVNGAHPVAALIEDAAGALYGTTETGGSGGQGIVFKLTPDHGTYSFSVLYTFKGGADGASPRAALVADNAGTLYGTTFSGGAQSQGTVFKLTPHVGGYIESLLHSFQGFGDGREPAAALTIDSSGTIYGTTSGGRKFRGTVFKLAPSGVGYEYSVLHVFEGKNDGATPEASVLEDIAGALYGTTSFGGTTGQGTIFKLTPDGAGYDESILYSFKLVSDGENPRASLIADSQGALYGTTAVGGDLGVGTVFRLVP